MTWRVIAAIAQKDLIDAIRNRYLLIALLTPLSIALLIRVLLPGLENISNLTIVVHDPDRSTIVSKLRAAPQIKLVNVDSAATARAEVEKIKASGALVIPPNFDADVAAGKQPKLTVNYTPPPCATNADRLDTNTAVATAHASNATFITLITTLQGTE